MPDQLVAETERKMKMSVEATQHEFATVRTGRANPALLDRITVEAYGGTAMPLNQLASITAPEPRLLVIQAWDKSVVSDIDKAITKSDLGLVPQRDGDLLRISIPQLTEERRIELTRVVGKKAEAGKVAVRNLRREANDELKRMEKDHGISEDDARRHLEHVQELTDKYIAEIDHLREVKEKELLEI